MNVVDDQLGSPTSVKTLSKAIQIIISNLQEKNDLNVFGTYHVTSDGETNWYLYATIILDILESLKVEVKLKKYKYKYYCFKQKGTSIMILIKLSTYKQSMYEYT